jgi:hypothetical protein
MGLNLPIRRVLFSTLAKFDGQGDRTLTSARCTRSPAAPAATASTTKASSACWPRPSATSSLRELLPKEPRAPRDFKAPVAPNWLACATPSPNAWASSSCARCWACLHGAAEAGRRAFRGGRAGADAGPGRDAGPARCGPDPEGALSSTRRRRWTRAPTARCRNTWPGLPAMPLTGRPARPGSWTRWTATAGSTAWSRRCAPARCGCGWTCASPASTAMSTRCWRCAAGSTTASSASSKGKRPLDHAGCLEARRGHARNAARL